MAKTAEQLRMEIAELERKQIEIGDRLRNSRVFRKRPQHRIGEAGGVGGFGEERRGGGFPGRSSEWQGDPRQRGVIRKASDGPEMVGEEGEESWQRKRLHSTVVKVSESRGPPRIPSSIVVAATLSDPSDNHHSPSKPDHHSAGGDGLSLVGAASAAAAAGGERRHLLRSAIAPGFEHAARRSERGGGGSADKDEGPHQDNGLPLASHPAHPPPHPPRMDPEPIPEPVPRVIPSVARQEPVLKRNRRMFGALLQGTLEKFKDEDKKRQGSKATLQRAQLLQRAEDRSRAESERLRQQEREEWEGKRKQDMILSARIASKLEEKDLQLAMAAWVQHWEGRRRCIKTKSRPCLLYLPARHSEATQSLLQAQQQQQEEDGVMEGKEEKTEREDEGQEEMETEDQEEQGGEEEKQAEEEGKKTQDQAREAWLARKQAEISKFMSRVLAERLDQIELRFLQMEQREEDEDEGKEKEVPVRGEDILREVKETAVENVEGEKGG